MTLLFLIIFCQNETLILRQYIIHGSLQFSFNRANKMSVCRLDVLFYILYENACNIDIYVPRSIVTVSQTHILVLTYFPPYIWKGNGYAPQYGTRNGCNHQLRPSSTFRKWLSDCFGKPKEKYVLFLINSLLLLEHLQNR